MGTDLTSYTPAPPVNYASELDGARALMKSGLLPAGIKSPEAAMFVILTGRDLGLSPVQSLRSIHVIQGKIEVAADAQLGLFHRAGGKSQWVTLTNEQATLKLVAPWLIEPHVESFSIADAKQAKLGGDNWAKYPKAMLRSRAITAGLKSIGFDPTAGIYGAGEISGSEAVVVDAEVMDGAVVPSEPVQESVVGDTGLVVSLEKMLAQVDPATADKARKALADGHDPRKVLNRLTEKALLGPRPHVPVKSDGLEGTTTPAREVIDMADKPTPRDLFKGEADVYEVQS
jgi:hypothetical protein